MIGARLTALLLRRDARRSAAALGLTAGGVAVATAIALLVVAVGPGLDRRVERLDGAFALPPVDLPFYRDLAAVAAVLLAVPASLLIGSAARLTAARREQRLATLRLAGATPGVVVVMTALETAAAGAVGAVAGVALYAAALPWASSIELAGAPWVPADLWLGWDVLVGAVLVVVALASVSAVVGLRSVVIGPLGVRQRVRGRRPRLVRFVGLGASWLAFLAAAEAMRAGGGLAPVLVGFAAIIGGVSLIGPWLAWLLGAVLAGTARRASTLLAGRRITDDPKAAYRTVSGIVLGGLVAGFLFGVMPTVDTATGGSAADQLLLEDLRRASVLVAGIALALATTAGTVAAAGSILDQRQTLARLRLAGTPISVLQRARAWQSALPLVVATTAAIACGVGVGLSLLLAFGAPPERVVTPELAPLGVLVVAALGGGLASAALTRPVLVAATSAPLDDR